MDTHDRYFLDRVSNRLLEQDLGTSVFVRTTRGVRPTAAGDAFISHATQILQQYRAA